MRFKAAIIVLAFLLAGVGGPRAAAGRRVIKTSMSAMRAEMIRILRNPSVTRAENLRRFEVKPSPNGRRVTMEVSLLGVDVRRTFAIGTLTAKDLYHRGKHGSTLRPVSVRRLARSITLLDETVAKGDRVTRKDFAPGKAPGSVLLSAKTTLEVAPGSTFNVIRTSYGRGVGSRRPTSSRSYLGMGHLSTEQDSWGRRETAVRFAGVGKVLPPEGRGTYANGRGLLPVLDLVLSELR